MDSIILLPLLLASLFTHPLTSVAQPPTSRITVVGAVYCDVCSSNTFTRHSYFLPGVDVHLECKFKANSPGTAEQISFSVNRTTNQYGVYELEIPSVDGVDCVEGPAIESMCQASLIRSPSSACDVAGFKTTSNEVSVKSKQANLCIYCLDALSYRPSKRNVSLCGNYEQVSPRSLSLNSSKLFLPYFPPYNFPWPPLPHLPPLPKIPFPPMPPFPSLPFPPSPFTKPPPLHFPFPSIPPTPSLFFTPPPPPAFNLRDPRTWIPNIPPLSGPPPPPPPPPFNLRDPRTWIPNIPPLSGPPPPPPPPPPFNLRDPRTWIPNVPILSAPPPPAFNLRDPRTWIPHIPPSPPSSPENQHP